MDIDIVTNFENGDYEKNVLIENVIELHLAIWSVASSSYHFMEITPINNLTITYAPYADLGIKRTTNEVPVIYWVELDACYCSTNFNNMTRLSKEAKKDNKRKFN